MYEYRKARAEKKSYTEEQLRSKLSKSANEKVKEIFQIGSLIHIELNERYLFKDVDQSFDTVKTIKELKEVTKLSNIVEDNSFISEEEREAVAPVKEQPKKARIITKEEIEEIRKAKEFTGKAPKEAQSNPLFNEIDENSWPYIYALDKTDRGFYVELKARFVFARGEWSSGDCRDEVSTLEELKELCKSSNIIPFDDYYTDQDSFNDELQSQSNEPSKPLEFKFNLDEDGNISGYEVKEKAHSKIYSFTFDDNENIEDFKVIEDSRELETGEGVEKIEVVDVLDLRGQVEGVSDGFEPLYKMIAESGDDLSMVMTIGELLSNDEQENKESLEAISHTLENIDKLNTSKDVKESLTNLYKSRYNYMREVLTYSKHITTKERGLLLDKCKRILNKVVIGKPMFEKVKMRL